MLPFFINIFKDNTITLKVKEIMKDYKNLDTVQKIMDN
jgi:hypothetical protein